MTPIPEFPDSLPEPIRKMMVKYGFFFWLMLATTMVLGFKAFTPAARIEHIEQRIDTLVIAQDSLRKVHFSLDMQEKQMVRWMCVKSTTKEILLSGLQCGPTVMKP